MKKKNYEKNDIAKHLCTFGEVGVVKVKYDKIQNKIKDKGKTMVFVGYEEAHESNVYHMYVIDTK